MSAATRAELSKMKSALVKANRRRAALEDAVAKLTRENDTLRLTPLLATAGGAGGAAATRRVRSYVNNVLVEERVDSGQSSAEGGAAAGWARRTQVLHAKLEKAQQEVRDLRRSDLAVKLREAEALNEEYASEVSRLQILLFGPSATNGTNVDSSAARFVSGVAQAPRLARPSSTPSAKRRGKLKKPEAALRDMTIENKRLRRELEKERDLTRRLRANDALAEDIGVELEPARLGFTVGDVIEAQNGEIERLQSEREKLHAQIEEKDGLIGVLKARMRIMEEFPAPLHK